MRGSGPVTSHTSVIIVGKTDVFIMVKFTPAVNYMYTNTHTHTNLNIHTYIHTYIHPLKFKTPTLTEILGEHADVW